MPRRLLKGTILRIRPLSSNPPESSTAAALKSSLDCRRDADETPSHGPITPDHSSSPHRPRTLDRAAPSHTRSDGPSRLPRVSWCRLFDPARGTTKYLYLAISCGARSRTLLPDRQDLPAFCRRDSTSRDGTLDHAASRRQRVDAEAGSSADHECRSSEPGGRVVCRSRSLHRACCADCRVLVRAPTTRRRQGDGRFGICHG